MKVKKIHLWGSLALAATALALVIIVLPVLKAGAQDPEFKTTWRTTTSSESITIPTNGGSGYLYDIDWGDGNTETGKTASASHTYTVAGDYQVIITGTYPGIKLNGGASAPKLRSVDQWGTNAWSSAADAFNGAVNMQVLATDAPNLSVATSMASMFQSASTFNADISSWDVSNIQDMSGMFFDAAAFNNGGVPLNWGNKLANVANMSSMFAAASDFNQDVSAWDVSNVTNMDSMFSNASDFNNGSAPLNWGQKTSKVTNMAGMFSYASAFNQDISGWNVSNVTTMTGLFQSTSFSSANYNALISRWSDLSLKQGVALGVDAKYCDVTSHNILANIYNWTITDLGVGSDCHTITYSAGANGTISGHSIQGVNNGTNGVPVTAVANSGYQFSSWSDASVSNPRTDYNVSADISVTANFTAVPVVQHFYSSFFSSAISISALRGSTAAMYIKANLPVPDYLSSGSVTVPAVISETPPQWIPDATAPTVPENTMPTETPTETPTQVTLPPTVMPDTGTLGFSKNLQIGMHDPEVLELQKYLNAHSFPVAPESEPGSTGHETDYFGSATKAAVAAFQTANNITPAVGFFGPITRAALAK